MLGQGPIAGQAIAALPGSGVIFVLSATTGMFALTGEAATFSATLSAAQGSYALNGQPASPTFQLVASTGLFSLAGFTTDGSFSAVQRPMKVVQDQFDVDEWGRFYRGGGMRYTL